MKLTDTQRALLEAAAQHPQKKLTNFPDTLKGGARIKVLTSMHNAALIEPGIAEPEVYVATATGQPSPTKTRSSVTGRSTRLTSTSTTHPSQARCDRRSSPSRSPAKAD
jgi:hypothetical protein